MAFCVEGWSVVDPALWSSTLLTFPFCCLVAPPAQDLIVKLLNPDAVERFTIDEALDHAWLQTKVAGKRKRGGAMTTTSRITSVESLAPSALEGAAEAGQHQRRARRTSGAVASGAGSGAGAGAGAGDGVGAGAGAGAGAMDSPARRTRARTGRTPASPSSPTRRAHRSPSA